MFGSSGRLAVLIVALAVAVAAPAPAAAVQARPADSFVDSIGANVHLPDNGTPYGERFGEVRDELQRLGVRHVRDVLFVGVPEEYSRLRDLAALGIHSTLILGDPDDGSWVLGELLALVRESLGDSVEAVEGPNEFSTRGGAEWQPHLVAYQRRLYEAVAADPALAGLPVVGPSIVHGDQDELGDVSAWLDFGNIHSYPQGNPPDKLGSAITRAELNSGSKPILATETGYNTALNWAGENRPVSEAAMATYMPRLFFEYYRWGIDRTFAYELVDEHADPGLANREDHFGLLRHDLSEKPAFAALRNTISILADPGPAFTAGALGYTLSDGGVELSGPESPELHKVLLQRRDGSFDLALWRPTSVWDRDAQQALEPGATPVTVGLPPGYYAAAVYRPNQSAEAVWTSSLPSDSLSLDVGPEVAIVELRPVIAVTPPPVAKNQGEGPPPVVDPPPPPPVPHCVVPKLKGGSLPADRKRLRRAGCKLGTVTGPRGRAARVVRQRPRPGVVLDEGASVSVVLGR